MGSEIDIVIPSYNAARQIEECLDHVFASDYENFQVTVVDDHSTDDSLIRVARYPSVNIIAHKENKGVSAARNQGISETRGDIILFIDSDVLIPKTLLRQVDNFFPPTQRSPCCRGGMRIDPTIKTSSVSTNTLYFPFGEPTPILADKGSPILFTPLVWLQSGMCFPR